MRLLFLSLFSLTMFIAGCSTDQKAARNKSPHIVKAGYHHWSHVPLQNSTVPEKGTDLALIVKDFPSGAKPTAIIYQHHKSFRPVITDTTKAGILISARIVTASSVLHTLSKKTTRSDRLVYQKKDSTANFITIDHWVPVNY